MAKGKRCGRKSLREDNVKKVKESVMKREVRQMIYAHNGVDFSFLLYFNHTFLIIFSSHLTVSLMYGQCGLKGVRYFEKGNMRHLIMVKNNVEKLFLKEIV